VVAKLIDPVQARPVSRSMPAPHPLSKGVDAAKECLRSGTTRPDLTIIVEPVHAQPNTRPRPLKEKRRAVLAAVKAKPCGVARGQP
jgi:hypothetical protein